MTKYLITDAELEAYAEGSLSPEEKRELEHRAVSTSQSALLLNVSIAHNACFDDDLDDLIGAQPKDAKPVKLAIPLRFARSISATAACMTPPPVKKGKEN